MVAPPEQSQPVPETPVLFTVLPGPDRKRTRTFYRYRLTYRNPDAGAVGCGMIWEVSGGRHAYQIALERDEAGNVRLHCTCADAVFRAEEEGRFCKHVLGLLDFGKPRAEPPPSGCLGA
ncbi:MAG TPA: hypothetical protein VFA26_02605 [Gemmataceae bacterium]|nr:hypothetical protein [Gemmataceae bacterium]